MCMEDIRIGRKSSSWCKVFSITAGTAQTIASANPRRIALTIGNGGGSVMMAYPAVIADQILAGFPTASGCGPLYFDLGNVGSMLWQEWRAQPSAGTVLVTVIETILDEQ